MKFAERLFDLGQRLISAYALIPTLTLGLGCSVGSRTLI
jgi:hypothetical protein